MPKPPAKFSERKQKSSPDYPKLAQILIEASGEGDICKLPAGLYIVATPIGNLGDISLRALLMLAGADRIACEDTRNSGSLLAKFGIKKPLVSYHDHNEGQRAPEMLKHIAAGEAIALVSDAGLPLIADPGYKLVQACVEAGYRVTVIPGANAALTALAGSGLPANNFHFAGFLPPKSTARQKVLESLKNISATLVFYEAPQRLAASLKDLAKIFGSRQAAVARELTKLFEETRRGNLNELAAFYADSDVKGEIVVIVSPANEGTAVEYDVDALLTSRLKTLSVRDAVNEISALTGTKKSEVYAKALKIK